MIASYELDKADAMEGVFESVTPAVGDTESLAPLADLDALPRPTETAEAIEHAMDSAANVMAQPALPDEPEPAPATPVSSEPAVVHTLDMGEDAAMAMPMSEAAPAYFVPSPVEIEVTSAPECEAPASASEPEIAPAMISTSKADEESVSAMDAATALAPTLTNSEIAATAPTSTKVEELVEPEGVAPAPTHDESAASTMVPVLVEDYIMPLAQALQNSNVKPVPANALATVVALALAAPVVNQAFAMALKFAERGIPVFPLWGFKGENCACGELIGSRYCRPGKHPRQLASFKGASISASIITSWFTHYGPLNYGIATGQEIANSGMMIVVVDIDAYKLEAQMTLDALERDGYFFPDTAEVHTGGGGRHLYYLVKCGTVFEQTAGPGIDLKGIGGYVVGPGSTHATGRLYEFEASSDLFDGQEIADMPQWMYDKFAKKAQFSASLQNIALPAGAPGDEVTDAQMAEYKLDLEVIPADDYPVWLDVLMALKSRSRSEKMFALADWWSKKSAAYKDVDDVRYKWDQIKGEGGITIKSLKRLADAVRNNDVDISRLLIEPARKPEDDAIEEWPAPEPINFGAEATTYPLDALPELLKTAVIEVQAFTKAPVAMVACSALSTLSLAAQSLYDVQRAEGLTGPIGLYFMTVANSGERKTTMDGMFSAPIHQYEARCATEAKTSISEYTADYAAWEATRKGILDGIARDAKQKDGPKSNAKLRAHEITQPLRPLVPRLIYSDVTPEALKHNLAVEWPSGGIISSEGGAVFGGHGMKKDNQMGNMATLNELWDGKPGRTDRRTTQAAILKNARLTVAIQVQEATLKAFLGTSNALARGTGFLARYLVAWPMTTMGTRSFTEPPSAWPMRDRFRQRIADILNAPQPIVDRELKPNMLTLTKEAKVAWVGFHDEIESQLGLTGSYHAVCDVASKAADNAVRIAALFHVLEGETDAVSETHMVSANRIARWHLNESYRLYGGLTVPQELEAAAKLNDWLVAHCKKEQVEEIGFTALLQCGPNALRKKALLEPPLEQLVGLGRVKVCVAPARTIHLNPALLN
jgi:hypothetical protein